MTERVGSTTDSDPPKAQPPCTCQTKTMSTSTTSTYSFERGRGHASIIMTYTYEITLGNVAALKAIEDEREREALEQKGEW